MNQIITGMMIVTPTTMPSWYRVPNQPTPEPTAPAPREWVNRDDVVWCLTIEYRKPSLGDAGVIGTYKTHERAKEALEEYAGRKLTREERSDGAVYGPDETLEIVEQELEG